MELRIPYCSIDSLTVEGTDTEIEFSVASLDTEATYPDPFVYSPFLHFYARDPRTATVNRWFKSNYPFSCPVRIELHGYTPGIDNSWQLGSDHRLQILD